MFILAIEKVNSFEYGYKFFTGNSDISSVCLQRLKDFEIRLLDCHLIVVRSEFVANARLLTVRERQESLLYRFHQTDQPIFRKNLWVSSTFYRDPVDLPVSRLHIAKMHATSTKRG